MNILIPIIASSRRRFATITGTPFPGETLTSNAAGQWFADDVAVSGQTATTYIVRLDDIGRSIRQTRSNTLVVWKPGDIAGVAAFWTAYRNVYNSIEPNVLATNGQTTRHWVDIISGIIADSGTGTSQPLYTASAHNGHPGVTFDGNDDVFWLSNLGLLKNKSQVQLIASYVNTNYATGGKEPMIFGAMGTNWGGPRIWVSTRLNNNRVNAMTSARPDDIATQVATWANQNDGNFTVLTAHADYGGNASYLRKNGVQVATNPAMAGSGNTTDTNSASIQIGNFVWYNWTTFAFGGPILTLAVVNAAITATERSQLERYAGLFGGLNIPLL